MGAKISWGANLSELEDSFPEPAPPAADKPQNFHIKVSFDPNAPLGSQYEARWGGTRDWVDRAQSIATALRLLANRFEDAGVHGSDTELMSQLAHKADVLCKYCYAPIFFAKLPPPSTKFLAFDPEPIEASQVVGTRSARFRSNGDIRGRPQALWVPPNAVGPVWIPHPECCGSKIDEPINLALKKRWKERHQISVDKKNKVINGLREIAKDVNKGILDDLEFDLS